jgi:hypothetical protein
MKTPTNAQRILRSAAFQYANARMQSLRRSHTDWINGFEEGLASSSGNLLKMFLRDMPRRVQLEIGAKIRNEVAGFKSRYAGERFGRVTPAQEITLRAAA